MQLSVLSSKITICALVAILIAGCGGGPEEDTVPGSIGEVYSQAQKAMKNGNFARAIFILEQIQSRFPFDPLGKQAQLDLLYSFYKSGRDEEAIDAAEQFIRENPTHPRVDYALYIQGLTYFDEDPGRFAKMLGVDRAERPPAENRQALAIFKRLVRALSEQRICGGLGEAIALSERASGPL